MLYPSIIFCLQCTDLRRGVSLTLNVDIEKQMEPILWSQHAKRTIVRCKEEEAFQNANC